MDTAGHRVRGTARGRWPRAVKRTPRQILGVGPRVHCCQRREVVVQYARVESVVGPPTELTNEKKQAALVEWPLAVDPERFLYPCLRREPKLWLRAASLPALRETQAGACACGVAGDGRGGGGPAGAVFGGVTSRGR